MRRWLCGILAALMLISTFTDMSIRVRAEEATESTEATDPTETTLPTEPVPSDPTDPTEPVPSDPTDPTEPVPSDPTDPTEPVPSDPTDPTEPVPSDPTDPTEPVPSDPTDPTEPVPSDPADPTEPVPSDPTDPTEPVPSDPTEPAPTDPPPTEPEPVDPNLPVDHQTAVSSKDIVRIIKIMEGFNKYPYWDVSQYSVGYGTRCPDDKLEEYRQNGIPEAEAERLLMQELAYFEGQVRKFLVKYNLPFNQFQFDCLVSFSYNRGASWMQKADHPLVLTLTKESSSSQILHDFALYSVSQGSFILTRRRLSETYLFLEGVYEAYNTSSDGTYPSNYRYVYLDGNGGELFKTSYYTYIMHAYNSKDPIEIIYNFSTVPTGVDAAGNPFTYTLAGWFTAPVGGDKVEILDGSLADGTVLYAQWADPEGNIVPLPKGTVREPLVVTVKNAVNVRTGPGTYFAAVYKAAAGDTLTITETYTYAGTLWGKCESGWVSLTYTNYQDILNGNTGSDENPDEGEENPDSQWPQNGIVTTNTVNVRSGPGTSYPIVYQLNTGDAVVISDYYNDGTLEWGKLADGNWICLKYVKLEVPEQPPVDPDIPSDPQEPEVNPGLPGDINGDEIVNEDDAIHLLRYLFFPEEYPVANPEDYTGDGIINEDDAIYLLRYVFFPEEYPLRASGN